MEYPGAHRSCGLDHIPGRGVGTGRPGSEAGGPGWGRGDTGRGLPDIGTDRVGLDPHRGAVGSPRASEGHPVMPTRTRRPNPGGTPGQPDRPDRAAQPDPTPGIPPGSDGSDIGNPRAPPSQGSSVGAP